MSVRQVSAGHGLPPSVGNRTADVTMRAQDIRANVGASGRD
jgi:hypothetical protein